MFKMFRTIKSLYWVFICFIIGGLAKGGLAGMGSAFIWVGIILMIVELVRYLLKHKEKIMEFLDTY